MYFLLCFSLICILCGCKQRSCADFQQQARVVIEALIQDLRQIEDLEDLMREVPLLQEHFDELVSIMIEAKKWQIKTKTPVQCCLNSVDENCELRGELNKKLMSELNRLLRDPLARHFLEKAQQQALERLDAFEKKCAAQKRS